MQPILYDALPTSVLNDSTTNAEFKSMIKFQEDYGLAHCCDSTTRKFSEKILALLYILCASTILIMAINLGLDFRNARREKIGIDTLPRPEIWIG